MTHASDIYSLGILVYEMLTGILPWGGDFALAIRQLDAAEELPDPRDLNPELPSGLAGALRQLTAANAADRPASATEALRLVVKALQDDAAPALENVRVTPVPRLEDDSWVAEDAEFLMRRAMDGWDPWTKRFKFRSTHFWLVDSVYSQAKRHGLTLDDAHYQFMLRGALTYGRNLDFWWQKLADSRARLQVCEQAIANEGETAVARALARMLDEPGAVPRSEDALNALIELSAEAAGPEVRSNALNVLARSVDANTRWQAVGFTPTGDKELASLALSDSREANRAARLIGRARSETAVQAMVRAQGGPEAARILPALMEVRDAAGSLPDSTPALLRFRVGAELARRQLLEDRATLTRAYVAAGLGSALGLGFTVYATFRLPSYLDAKRILDAAGSGLLFGLVIGLGIFLTRLIAHRLRVLPLWAREALGIGVGALMINLGIVSYHNLFLDSAPVGWLIALGSFLVALGFGVGAALARSRLLSALVSATAIGMGLGLSWHLALRTGLTPMLYYELDRPVQTVFLIAVSSLLMGSVAHIVDLSKE